MDKPLISVIVPIYNVEPYLNRCLESIVNQNYQNLEIILVDDGSPDNCPQICDEWAKKDSRIVVLHVKNGGAGYARNKGIDKATGEWCVLVDGDDYLHENMILHLYNNLEDNMDLSECCIVKTTTDVASFSEKNEDATFVVCDAEQALLFLIKNEMFCQTPPNKIYRTRIIKKIPFPEGNLIDDEFWTYKVIGECKSLNHSSLKLYAYRQQEKSVMHKKYSIKRLQAVDAKYERLQYVSDRFPSLICNAKIDLLGTCVYQAQMIEKNCDGDEKEIGYQKLKTIISKLHFNQVEKGQLSFSQKLWFLLAKLSLKKTCKIKNALNIGF